MAVPGYGFFGLTSDPLINATTHGYYWVLGADRTIDWSLSNGFTGFSWTPTAYEVVNSILNNISQYTNLRFNYAGYYGNPALAASAGSEINVAWAGVELFSSPSIWGRAFFPAAAGYGWYAGDSGDVFLNWWSGAGATPHTGVGTAVYALLIHEIAHALGLKHPHDDGGTGRPKWSDIGIGGLDVDFGSVMSYEDHFAWNLISWDPATPMAMDVLALQYLYGKNMATNAGDSLHQLQNTGFYQTLWDASGEDVVSAAGQSQGWTIQLPIYQPSKSVDTKIGYAGTRGSAQTLYWLAGDFEHAAGTAYADDITGNWQDNGLIGGPGNDIINGGSGIDTAWFTAGQFFIQRSGATLTITSSDGVDTLTNVERIRVGDLNYAVDIDGAGGQAYRLYQAAFNRKPDPAGLGYQINALDTGTSLFQVAQNFINSPEFQRTYGALTDPQFVTQLYANVLHRAPDPGGLAYHVGNLANGTARAAVLVGFSESPENQAALLGVTSVGMLYS